MGQRGHLARQVGGAKIAGLGQHAEECTAQKWHGGSGGRQTHVLHKQPAIKLRAVATQHDFRHAQQAAENFLVLFERR
jgi:hypothetical protein